MRFLENKIRFECINIDNLLSKKFTNILKDRKKYNQWWFSIGDDTALNY